MIMLARGAFSILYLLLVLSCSPPALFLEPVIPSVGGKIPAQYEALTWDELEALFVRPFTGRTLDETSGTTSAMLYDYAWLTKWVGAKSGAYEALTTMQERYIDSGASFRVILWGEIPNDLNISRWSFKLRTKDRTIYDPTRVEQVGGTELMEQSIRGEMTWKTTLDVAFPLVIDRSVSMVVLEAWRDDVEIQHHTWKFKWESIAD